MAITFTEEFRQALDLISAGRNVLISGKAGTGKSTLLREFLENTGEKEVLVTAPTGVAALNIEGFTIHRAFGFRPSMVLSDLDKGVVGTYVTRLHRSRKAQMIQINCT